MTDPTDARLREEMVKTCRAMNACGINQGTAGNISVRNARGYLLTPTSLPYDVMGANDVVQMYFDGTYEGARRPSSEWRFHRDILQARPDIDSVVHCHSPYATTLAVHHKEIPSFHYMTGIFGTPAALQPLWWVACYLVFVGLNVVGVELSFRVTLAVTLAALLVLIVFWVSALPNVAFARWALDIGPGGEVLPDGNGPFLPMGFTGALAALPFAVWLFLAIEQLPLAAEESHDPKRDMPKGIIAGMCTLIVSALMILWLNPSLAGVGAFALGRSGEPLLDGFRAIFGGGLAKLLALVAVVGLVASLHTIIFAQGRQIYSLSRAGYFPKILSLTHGRHRTPHVAMLAGATLGLVVMLTIWLGLGPERGSALIGGMLLNMAVFGAMFSYILQAVSFLLLRRRMPDIERPYRSPLGEPGAMATIVIAMVTLCFQLLDPVYRSGVLGVAVWFVALIAYFALYARHRMVRSPEEEFAITGRHIEGAL